MNELTDMRRVLRVRLSEEACVDTAGSLDASFLEDCGQLFYVGIEGELADCRDELVEVHGRLPRLDGIGLRAGCILGRQKSLLERDWCGCLVVVTATRDEREHRQCCEEWDGEAHDGDPRP